MPKLWRAPIPTVRITAPQITAIQKLRSCGFSAALDKGRDMPRLFALNLVACIMVGTRVCFVNEEKELRQHAIPDRPQPRARRRMVEHSHSARRAAWAHAFRRVSGKPRHCAQHADAAAECTGRVRAPRAPPLQRAPAARRVP